MKRQNPRFFRLSATVAIGALLCNGAVPPAWAQPAPPAGAPTPGQNQGDPPARVGRIASETGAVAFRTNADTQWSAATANYPVSAGNSFWTEPNARAELEISTSRIDLSGQTEFDLTTLDANGMQAVAQQGELYFHLLNLGPNEVWSVQTPRGTVQMSQPGRYDIVVGTTDQPTQVTVLEGAAQIDGPGVSLKIAANQTATVTGTDQFQGTAGAVVRDAFLAARLAAERAPSTAPTAVQAQLTYMSGGEDLSGYGQWSQESDYGEVWYPQVAASWVPYRDGEWAYVAPWGWTWVDSNSWGFAPFHYGRWARIHDRWGWIPGEAQAAERPVYAPALVTFIGIGAGVAVGAALAHGSVGWVPLGPHEAYHPWYHASESYVRQVNIGHVKDVTTINNNVTINNYANRAAATSVPANVMLSSRPVRGEARPIPAQALASAHPVIGQDPVRPTVGTLGVTPAVAHQLNLQAAQGVAPRHTVPGPVVRAQAPGEEHGQPPRPGLVGPHGEQPGGAARPGEPAAQGPGANHAPGAPPLAGAGARPGEPPAAGTPPGTPPGTRPGTPPGAHPENGPHTGPGPETNHGPGGTPPLATPGERPAGVPGSNAGRPGEPPSAAHPPEGAAHPGPGAQPGQPPAAEHPGPEARPGTPAAPPHEAPPHAAGPEHAAPARPTPEAHPAPPPHEAPPHAAPPPHEAAPPREAPHPAAPPPHPAAPPPHEAPAPHPAAPPPHPAAPPPHEAPHPAAPEKKPGEH